jgi:hypothetical protein
VPDLGGLFVRGDGGGELEGRQGSDELGMGAPNVKFGGLEQLFLVFSPERVATAAADRVGDIDSHLANRTAEQGLVFRAVSPRP